MQLADSVLREVFIVLAGIFVASWLTYALAFRKSILVGALFALSNFWVGLGVWLMTGRSGAPSLLHYQIADWLIIAGFTALWLGTHHVLESRKRAWWITLAPLLLAISTTAWLAPDPSSYLVRALAFNLVCAGVTYAIFYDIYRGLTHEKLNLFARIAVAWPLLLSATTFAVRGIQIYLLAAQSDAALRDSLAGFVTFLWVFLANLVLSNVAMVMLVAGRLIAEMRDMATRDPLTGALNRRFIHEYFQQEHARYQRTGQPLSCITIDIDHFKQVNDHHGHDAGDTVLVHVCNTLREQLRVSDILIRYGGEEFFLMCPDTNYALALEVAERLRKALLANPAKVREGTIALTASFGVAALRTGDAMEAILKRSDLALYQAKQQGRNRVCGESSA